MNSEHCARVRARLDELQDGALAPLEAARDHGHLEACADCAREARARADWLAHVQAELAPPRASQRDADARVAQALAATALPRRRAATRRVATAALLAAAALALLTLLPALPGGDSTLRAWSDGARLALAPFELPPVDWNPQALAPRMGH
jgi:hypothetical protein